MAGNATKKEEEKVVKKHGSPKRQGKMPRYSKEHTLFRRATLSNATAKAGPLGASAPPSPAVSPSPTPHGSLKRKAPYGDAQEEKDQDAIGKPDV